jgi:DNA-binding NarL/FixJ family response regulator
MAQKLVEGYLNLAEWDKEIKGTLSPREIEILHLLVEGHTSKEIAEKLVLSPSTVHTHRSNLMNKLGLNNRHELLQYARRQGLLP